MTRETIRVGVVSPHYPPRIGGVERYAERLAKKLQISDRHEVVVLCANEGRRTVVETRDNVLIYRLGTWFRVSNTPINPMWLWQIPRLLTHLRVDAVSVHSPVPFMADIVALFSKARPIVLTYHCQTLLKGQKLTDLILGPYERYVLPRVFRRCEGLVGVAPVAVNEEFDRARLVEVGVDVSLFIPAPDEFRGEPTVVYVGRVERTSRWKGLDVLLDSFQLMLRQVPDAKLEIVGTGDWIPELRERAKTLGVDSNVRWRGTLEGAELVDAYRRASVVVLPSVTDSELFGTVLIEAMACGTPVVASNVGGVRYTIRDGVDGLLVPPGDREALAEACLAFLADSDLAARVGAAGREAAVGHWEWSKIMGKMLSYIDELVDESRNSAVTARS